MIIGVLQEPSFETRVSLLPEAVATLTKKGIAVLVETGAGLKASASDEDYEKAGAQIKSGEEIANGADILLQPPHHDVVEHLLTAHLHAAREAIRVEHLEQRREAIRMAIVGRCGQEESMLEAAREITDGPSELRLDAISAAALL